MVYILTSESQAEMLGISAFKISDLRILAEVKRYLFSFQNFY